MKASLSSWSFRVPFGKGQMDLLGFVDEAKRLGADGLEILPSHVRTDDPAGHLKQLADKARALGMEIASVIAGNSFSCRTAGERAEQVERMKRWIVAAASAGIGRLNTFTGYHTPGDDPLMEYYRVIDSYREVCATAQEHGVLLCIENHSSVASDADGMLSIIRAVGSPALRTNPDPSNFVRDFTAQDERKREAIYTETARIAPLASNAHLKVADFTDDGEHAFLDTRRIMDIFRQAGYDGHVVLEIYGPGEDPAATSAKGLALLRRYM
jgi:sugar phosphate isomerase/epimerase